MFFWNELKLRRLALEWGVVVGGRGGGGGSGDLGGVGWLGNKASLLKKIDLKTNRHKNLKLRNRHQFYTQDPFKNESDQNSTSLQFYVGNPYSLLLSSSSILDRKSL